MPQMTPSLNVGKVKLSEFLDSLAGTLGLMAMTDEELAAEDFTLEEVRHPLLAIGTGGGGKTEGIMATVQMVNENLKKNPKTENIQFGFKKIQLGQTIVGDLQGLPVVGPDGQVKKMTADDLPQIDPKQPDFNEYGVLFLDEISSANVSQVQPALGLADGTRSISNYKLPQHWLVVGAGNGPDCTNFVRLDSITLRRFEVFDLIYLYADWKPWALSHKVLPEIFAFLEFRPEFFNVPPIDDGTKDENIGEAYPCGYTWSNLSIGLRKYKFNHKGDYPSDIGNFASRFVGDKAGSAFGEFLRFQEKVEYDPEKILQGKEKMPTKNTPTEVAHLVIERCALMLKNELAGKGQAPQVEGADWIYPTDKVERVANFFNWLLALAAHDLDLVVHLLVHTRNTSEDITNISLSMMFDDYCPNFSEFSINNRTLITQIQGELEDL